MSPRAQTTVEVLESLLNRGVWGTCAECPQDLKNAPQPHLCVNKARYDHQISVEEGLQKIAKDVKEAVDEARDMEPSPMCWCGHDEGHHPGDGTCGFGCCCSRFDPIPRVVLAHYRGHELSFRQHQLAMKLIREREKDQT